MASTEQGPVHIDYIHAQLGEAVMLTEIVEQSRVPGRTLFKHFRDFTGTSPMRYLNNARFNCVRDALRHAQPGELVSEIAMRCGFTHMGKFSVEYRQRFAEAPSRTLAKGRRGRSTDD